ncbi:hypothetical protein CMV_030376 [Castanea mollissima]|uniref:Uncharacterized protein n=1 Tax=Castanea mollissima TaxID=60419 RepID=A0A8J4QCM7_9ROSI|nr:hypothetical protein CMV_030376 [Castanea mollissima]
MYFDFRVCVTDLGFCDGAGFGSAVAAGAGGHGGGGTVHGLAVIAVWLLILSFSPITHTVKISCCYSYLAVLDRLRFMASKPHHLLPLPNSATTVASKRARTMSTDSSSSSSSPIKDTFTKYTQYLNTLRKVKERISKYNREEVLEKAEKDLKAVTDQYISQLVKELHGTDFWKLRRAYSTGVASLCPNL